MIHRSVLVAGLLLCLGPHVTAQPMTDPSGPGALALVGGGPDSADAIRRGLTSADPLTRTVAARLAGIRDDRSLAGDLVAGLNKETDPVAEAEMAGALLYIGGAVAFDALMPRLQRAAPTTIVVVGNWVARVQPERFAAMLPILAERLGSRVGRLRSAVVMAMQQRPDSAGTVLRAWLAVADGAGWSTVTRHAVVDLASDPQSDVVRAALASSNPEIREGTVWMLLFRLGIGQALPQAMLDGVTPGELAVASSGADLTWEALGRELIARQQGRTTPDRADYLLREAARHMDDAGRIAVLDGIAAAEVRALRSVLGDQYEDRDTLKKRRDVDSSLTGGAMRMLPLPWPGFLASLVTAAQCRVSDSSRPAKIHATYLLDGRQERVRIDPSMLPRGCERVIATLAWLLLADPDQRIVGPEGEWVLVPMDNSFLACSSHPKGPDVEHLDVRAWGHDGLIRPKKVRNVRPTYPAHTVRDRIEGAVRLEGDISSHGCLEAVRLVHGVHPALDWEALAAVAGWRFTPAEFQGAAVPVRMSVSVLFHLR
jgi:TonB family protein